MKKRVSSWFGLQPPSASPPSQPDAERKKQNRRSVSGLSQLLSNKQDTSTAKDEVNHDNVKALGPSRMAVLADKISTETEKLEAYLRANDLPDLGFGPNDPGDFPRLPEDIQKIRQEIIFATQELESLVRGPREGVRWQAWNFLDTLSLQIINHYGIAKLVPLDSTITLAELQQKTSLDPINLARVLRHGMTQHIFQEPSHGVIAHTAASRLLVEDEALQAWVGCNAEDIFPASAHVIDALKTYPEATSLTRAGFQFAFNTVDKEPMFVTFGKNPARAKRMGQAMVSLTGGEGYEVAHFVDNYDFYELNEKEGTFVDIGGSHGFVCVDLAKKWDKMRFVVQDLQKTVDTAPKPISDIESIADRVELQAHDFFTEQPVHGADVYYFRWIIHNYSTPYAVKILKNLIPALKPGSRIIINDHCLREAGSENPWDEWVMRGMDMVMLALLNAQEREEEEFRALFRAADERFVFKGVTRTKGCRMSIVEAVWEPTAAQDEDKPAVVANGAQAAGKIANVNGKEETQEHVVQGDDVQKTPAVQA